MGDLLTASEVARELKIARSSAYRLLSAGLFPVVRVTPGGGGLRVHRADLQAWIDGQRAEQQAAIARERADARLITDIAAAGRLRRARG